MLPDVLTVDCIAVETVIGQELSASKKVFHYIVLRVLTNLSGSGELVDCGGKTAASCADCVVNAPRNYKHNLCHGDCEWNLAKWQCVKSGGNCLKNPIELVMSFLYSFLYSYVFSFGSSYVKLLCPLDPSEPYYVDTLWYFWIFKSELTCNETDKRYLILFSDDPYLPAVPIEPSKGGKLWLWIAAQYFPFSISVCFTTFFTTPPKCLYLALESMEKP